MPPRTKGVASPFADCVILVCGRPGTINGTKWNHQEFKKIIVKGGGRSVRSVTNATTHVVATKDSLCGDTDIMAAAKSRGNLSFMKPTWLMDTKTKKKKPTEEEYVWDLEEAGVSQLKTQSAKIKTAKKIAEAEACVKDEPKEDGEAPPKTSAKSKPAAKSETKAKAKPKTPAKPKPATKPKKTAAEPKKTAAEPKTSVEPLTEYDVWVDDSKLVYDAYLTQTSSVTNRDRAYCIQVRKDPVSSTFKTRTKWGGVGKTPMYQVLGNGGHEEAVEIFKERFKSKTGLDWEDRLKDPIPEKYTYYSHDGGDDGATDHS